MANYNRTRIEQLKDAADPFDIAEVLGLWGRGNSKRFFCLSCQSSGNHKTPDLAVYSGGYKCFKCGKYWDTIDLVQLANNTDFKGAIGWLERYTGLQRQEGNNHPQITPKKLNKAVPQKSENTAADILNIRDNLTGILQYSDLYTAFLNGCQRVEKMPNVFEYLTGRKICVETINRLGLKFCGKEYKDLMSRLEKNFGVEELKNSGLWSFLGYFKQKVGFLVIPYLYQGKPVYLKARPPIEKATAEAKIIDRFRNTSGSVPCPYNIDTIAKAKQGLNQVLICEGETDVMAAESQGFSAVGIPSWGGFKPEWIKYFIDIDVYLVLDADSCGEKGSMRIAQIFLNAGFPLPRMIFLPNGYDLNEFFLTE